MLQQITEIVTTMLEVRQGGTLQWPQHLEEAGGAVQGHHPLLLRKFKSTLGYMRDVPPKSKIQE